MGPSEYLLDWHLLSVTSLRRFTEVEASTRSQHVSLAAEQRLIELVESLGQNKINIVDIRNINRVY